MTVEPNWSVRCSPELERPLPLKVPKVSAGRSLTALSDVLSARKYPLGAMVPERVMIAVTPPLSWSFHPATDISPPVVLWSSIHSWVLPAAVPPQATSLITTTPAATGVGVDVGDGVGVGVRVGVRVGVLVGVGVTVGVGVLVPVCVAVGVTVGVCVAAGPPPA